MTREEQVDWVCRLRAELNNGIIFTPWNKEFTEALTDILEQEPCDVAINRQAVIGLIADYDLSMEQVVKSIFALPPVTPEPKTGHWIYKNLKGQFCSICDEQSVWRFNYCPSCGARMIEPQESEDKE